MDESADRYVNKKRGKKSEEKENDKENCSNYFSCSDDDTNSTDPGTTDPGNGQNPEDNLWNNEDFGIQ